MQDAVAPLPMVQASEPAALPGAGWSDRRWLFLLFVVAVLLRVGQVANTEVASRDSIAYARYAWHLEHAPWGDVFRTGGHHPAYPVAVRLMSIPVRAVLANDLPLAMELSTQLVSCVASVLLVWPLFYFGKELFGPRVAFWGVLLFQCLPASGRLLADGLTEPLFFLFVALALWGGVRALRTGGLGWYTLCGLATGLAYLTRTEGLLVALSVGLTLLGLQCFRGWRQSTGRLFLCGGTLTVTTLLVAGPFMLHVRAISVKASARYMVDPSEWQKPASRRSENRLPAVEGPVFAMWNFEPNVKPEDRYGWAAYALVSVLNRSFFYILGIPAVLGIYLYRRRFAVVPGMWVMLILNVVLMLLLYRLGQSNGYLGTRHVMLIVLTGLFWSVAAIGAMLTWVRREKLGRWLALGVLLLTAGVAVPRTLTRLHGDRSAFKEAGLWLRQHTRPEDEIIDPFAWAHYQSGRVFQRAQPAHPGARYVVLERSENRHPHLWYLLEPAEELARRGVEVQRFSARRGKGRADVVIYRVGT